MINNSEIIFRILNPDGTLAGYTEFNNNNYGLFDSQGIFAGKNNTVSGDYAIVLAGSNNSSRASNSTILAGNNVNIPSTHSGAVFIGDYKQTSRTSSGPNTLTLDFSSGVFIKLNTIITSSNSPGTSGQISFDSNYFYRHNGLNWTRTALSTW